MQIYTTEQVEEMAGEHIKDFYNFMYGKAHAIAEDDTPEYYKHDVDEFMSNINL